MSSFVCPHCKALTGFTVIHKETGRAPNEPEGICNGAARCQNAACTKLVGVLVRADDGKTITDWWPKKVGGKDFPDVPEHIASTADEAHKCLSVGAHRGAIALARSVVEATAKHHGIEKGLLDKKIIEMAKQDIISDAMKNAADEIRFAGNEVAHADLAEEPIGQDDAEEVLELMDAILTRVFQEPRQVERVRERRQERRGQQSP